MAGGRTKSKDATIQKQQKGIAVTGKTVVKTTVDQQHQQQQQQQHNQEPARKIDKCLSNGNSVAAASAKQKSTSTGSNGSTKKSQRNNEQKGDSNGHRKNNSGKTRVKRSKPPADTCPCNDNGKLLLTENVTGFETLTFTGKSYRKQKSNTYNRSYSNRSTSNKSDGFQPRGNINNNPNNHNTSGNNNPNHNNYNNNKTRNWHPFASGRAPLQCVPITVPVKPVLSSTTIAAVIADPGALTIYEKSGNGRHSYPLMQKFLEELKKVWTRKKSKGRPEPRMEIYLYITLWFLSNQNSLREISDRFDYSIGWVYQTIIKVCKIICKLAEKYVQWPKSDEMLDILKGFENCGRGNKFPSVVGIVDGTHIKIRSPSEDSSSYYNRKGFHSIILQGICDHNLIFRDVFFGWPGASHDANVWKNSPIGKALADGNLELPHNSHLLGDAAYPLRPYLITPFRDNGHLSERERIFNCFHSSLRVRIEQAFGILKSKFRILNNLTLLKLENAKFIVLSTVVLHNFIRMNSTSLQINVVENLNLNKNQNEGEENHDIDEMRDGSIKRDVICEWIVSNLA